MCFGLASCLAKQLAFGMQTMRFFHICAYTEDKTKKEVPVADLMSDLQLLDTNTAAGGDQPTAAGTSKKPATSLSSAESDSSSSSSSESSSSSSEEEKPPVKKKARKHDTSCCTNLTFFSLFLTSTAVHVVIISYCVLNILVIQGQTYSRESRN